MQQGGERVPRKSALPPKAASDLGQASAVQGWLSRPKEAFRRQQSDHGASLLGEAVCNAAVGCAARKREGLARPEVGRRAPAKPRKDVVRLEALLCASSCIRVLVRRWLRRVGAKATDALPRLAASPRPYARPRIRKRERPASLSVAARRRLVAFASLLPPPGPRAGPRTPPRSLRPLLFASPIHQTASAPYAILCTSLTYSSSLPSLMSDRGRGASRGGPRGSGGGARGGRGGGGGAHRGGSAGGRGGAAGTAGSGPPDKKKEAILDLAKFVDKKIRVKFQGGREGECTGLTRWDTCHQRADTRVPRAQSATWADPLLLLSPTAVLVTLSSRGPQGV